MRTVSHWGGGGGGECFDIPVLLFLAVYGRVISCLWFRAHEQKPYIMFTCNLDILAQWTVRFTRTYQRLKF